VERLQRRKPLALGAGMRIRVPRRLLLLGILLCSLALAAASIPTTTLAKPIPWDPSNGPAPGDGDGSVVKGTMAPSMTVISGASSSVRSTHATVTRLSIWRTYLTALRLGYGWRWLW
jgi:hypothetical protein